MLDAIYIMPTLEMSTHVQYMEIYMWQLQSFRLKNSYTLQVKCSRLNISKDINYNFSHKNQGRGPMSLVILID